MPRAIFGHASRLQFDAGLKPQFCKFCCHPMHACQTVIRVKMRTFYEPEIRISSSGLINLSGKKVSISKPQFCNFCQSHACMPNPFFLLLLKLESWRSWIQNVCCCQGCKNRSILPSGMGARGVSSEHVENMEMFSGSPLRCSPVLQIRCALDLGEPCSG